MKNPIINLITLVLLFHLAPVQAETFEYSNTPDDDATATQQYALCSNENLSVVLLNAQAMETSFGNDFSQVNLH